MTIPMPVAIVGASCRLPGADGLDLFADLLFDGRDAVTEIPDDRWSKARYFHPTPGLPGKTYTFAAGCLEQIDTFDAAFFGISPREAVAVDPQQRLMLELAYEAIDDAGLKLSALAGITTGVYVGGSSWDFAANTFSDAAGLDAYSMQGAALSAVSNRVSYVFDLRGPSLTVDTACSSSLVALHVACGALGRGEIGAAIVGGVNLLLTPQSFVGFARASMLSRRGRCHSFDARADGYVRAEGGGALVLKPLAQALADGDAIRAVIRGSGVNSDGRTNGFLLPGREAQEALLRQVYAQAEVAPSELGYFEAHGTGTPVGDPIEARAIGEALARRRSEALPIGSVKSNVGHLEAASGMAGLMKAIVAFERGAVPASLHFETPNPNIPFGELNLDVVSQPRTLAAGQFIGINSFGFGGTNAHVILAPPPAVSTPPWSANTRDGEKTLPLLVSARCAGALRSLAGTWQALLERTTPERAPALLRGAARKREQHAYRLVVAPGHPADMATRLDTWLSGGWAQGVATGQAVSGGLAFVFAGNGSQWVGMARDALAHSPAFRAKLAEIDSLLGDELGWSVLARLRTDEFAALLRDTDVAQPLLLAIQVGCVAALRKQGIEPAACVGHSAGEVAAAWASGALTLAQACHVIVHRSLAQQLTHGTGVMAALGLGATAAADLFAREGLSLTIAAVNAARAVTVAGSVRDMLRLQDLAVALDCPFTQLDLDYAFHSPAMDPIREPLLAGLAGITSAAPRIPLISTVTGESVSAGDLDGSYWWRNVRQPVRFSDAAARLVESGMRIFLEIGPQPVLQSFLRDALARGGQSGQVLATLSRQVATADPFATIAANCHVAGANFADERWLDGPAEVRGLPAYPWQRLPVVPHRTIEYVDLLTPPHDHPLLGFRDHPIPDAWTSHLSIATVPYLADHQVDGVAVLPAAAMIEMALAAARTRHGGAASLEIQDFEISESLVLDLGAVRDCRTTVTANGQIELASRPYLSEERLTVHASGRVLAGLGTRPQLSPHVVDINHDTIDPVALYATAAALRLQYGPQFRTVTQVKRLDARRGVVELAAQAPDRTASGYLLDPAVVDGSLQALLAMAADTPHLAAQGSVLPWRFGRVRLLRPQGAVPCRADLHLRHIGPRSFCADIALIDATGEVVAELLDCWFVAMPAGRAALTDHTFWTAAVPSMRQPRRDDAGLLDRVLANMPGTLADGELPSMLLADACLAATAFETLQPAATPETGGMDIASPLIAAGLGWLAEDGLATRDAAGWRVADATDLPPSADIWRSLFFDMPQAVAECTLLAAFGGALHDPEAASLRLSAPLREQILFGSPSGAQALATLLHGIGNVAAQWPAGRCLRVAVAGALSRTLLRRIVEEVARHRLPLRLLALGHDAEAVGAVHDVLAQTPGATAKTWDAVGASDQHGFDVVLAMYGLSLPGTERVVPEALAGLLAPGGLLLAAEPAPSRLAELIFGHAADGVPALRTPAAWCAALHDTGFATARPIALDGALWPVALLAAQTDAALPDPIAERARPAACTGEASDLVVFAEPDDAVAEALAAPKGTSRRLPIEALKGMLTAPFAARLRHVLLLGPGTIDDSGGSAALAELLADIGAAMRHMPKGARLWLVSRGAPRDGRLSAALAGLRRVAANEISDLHCYSVRLEAELSDAEAAACITQELFQPDAEREVTWTLAGRLVPRLQHHMPAPVSVGGPRQLTVARPGLIGSLTWQPLAVPVPGPGEVTVAVHAAGLNFRDVMWAQGMLPDEALMEGFSGPSLGLECAGIVTEVGPGVDDLKPGDRVIAVAPAALATHVVTRRNGVMRMPAGLDFAEAATIPVAFITAVYGLGHLARLAPGERVLIHGGAGGVGLAAIQYALHLGAEVYATAGSDMRRQMLLRLGVAGAFDSRGTGFVDDVLVSTSGAGVDVVLNSLSGELMQQSVRLLRPFGRFLEIGKRDLYRNTAVGIRPLRHNASYFAIDTDELLMRRPTVAQAVLEEVAGLLEVGALRPLPYRGFGFADAVDAFRLLQSSGHVGKVVLLPEPTPVAAPVPAFTADPAGVYVVTGGLSGFGLEAARWLARCGARRLALIGRRGSATPGVAETLPAFTESGVRAEAFACDIADEAALGSTLARIRATLGPIRGVLHAAMVLDDAALQDLDAARFAAVIRPKLAGAIALDRLTRQDALDLFVLFSSVTTVIGTPGQANYVAANAALEAMAVGRHAQGLPALAVQWGPIGDAGYLVRERRVSEMLAGMLGVAHMRAAAALDALPALLACGRPVVGLADVDWGELLRRLPGLDTPAWSEMPKAARGTGSGEPMRARIAGLPREAALQAVLEVLLDELAGILKQSPTALDIDRPVLEFGVDSLMAVELRTALELRIGVQLPLMALGGASTLRAMAPRLLQAVQGEAPQPDDDLVETMERHEGLVSADALS